MWMSGRFQGDIVGRARRVAFKGMSQLSMTASDQH